MQTSPFLAVYLLCDDGKHILKQTWKTHFQKVSFMEQDSIQTIYRNR